MNARVLKVKRSVLDARAAYIALSIIENRDDCAMSDALAAIGSE